MKMKKIIVLICGIIILAFGTSICNNTGLGIDPFNAFCRGGSDIVGLSLGNFTLIAQLSIAIIVFCLDRKLIGIGTIIPMIGFGYVLQFFNWLLAQLTVFPLQMAINFIAFLIGMLLITLGMSIYMSTQLGMVPYDCISFVVGKKIGKNPFMLRVGLDVSVAVIALLMHGPISVGTILIAFGVGPLLDGMNQLFINKIAKAWKEPE